MVNDFGMFGSGHSKRPTKLSPEGVIMLTSLAKCLAMPASIPRRRA
jgi:hypothetical protein